MLKNAFRSASFIKSEALIFSLFLAFFTNIPSDAFLPTPPAHQLPDFVTVIDRVKNSVVSIRAETTSAEGFKSYSYGTGWIYYSDYVYSYIVTNDHVVKGAAKIAVIITGGYSYTGRITGEDPFIDLALIEISEPNLAKMSLGDPSTFQVGECVLTLGNALGQGITAKEGIISRLGVDLQNTTDQMYNNMIETSAIINEGNSGGPLVNMRAEIIGIGSLKANQARVEGMCYAINIGDAIPKIKLLKDGVCIPHPWTGISGDDNSQELQHRWGLPIDFGVFVNSVAKDGPAVKAGIVPGDLVFEINGEDLPDCKKFCKVVDSWNNGESISITFYRDRVQKTVEVTLIQYCETAP